MAATAVGPLIIGVAHDAGASYSAILRSIAATTALVGVICCLGLRTPQRRAAPPSSPSVSVSHSQELSESVQVQVAPTPATGTVTAPSSSTLAEVDEEGRC